MSKQKVSEIKHSQSESHRLCDALLIFNRYNSRSYFDLDKDQIKALQEANEAIKLAHASTLSQTIRIADNEQFCLEKIQGNDTFKSTLGFLWLRDHRSGSGTTVLMRYVDAPVDGP